MSPSNATILSVQRLMLWWVAGSAIVAAFSTGAGVMANQSLSHIRIAILLKEVRTVFIVTLQEEFTGVCWLAHVDSKHTLTWSAGPPFLSALSRMQVTSCFRFL